MTPLFHGLSFRAAAPHLLFLSSVSLTTCALHCHPKLQGRYFLAPVLILNALALLSIDAEATEWGPVGSLDSVVGLACCVFALVAPLVLWTEERSVLPELNAESNPGGTAAREKLKIRGDVVLPSRLSISTSLRIWNNSRALRFQNHIPGHEPWIVVVKFGLFRILKAGIILGSDSFIIRPIVAHVDSANYITHFAPDQRPLLRRLIIYHDPTIFDSHVLSVRALTAVYWIWDNYCVLESCHAALAVTAVCLLRIDDSSDWPPLFGNPCHAYTIRRFWGRFWHRCLAPPAGAWSIKVAQAMGFTKGSQGEKAAVDFSIFLLSGLSHGLIAWRKGGMAPWSDILFFVANFVIVSFEMLISGAFRKLLELLGCHRFLESARLGRLGRYFGYVWVFSWFFWVTPRWLYPKYYTMSLR